MDAADILHVTVIGTIIIGVIIIVAILCHAYNWIRNRIIDGHA
jgi:hypothetical protein